MLARLLRILLTIALLGSALAHAQAVTKPTWNELTAIQREALGPLQSEWNTMDNARKQKWLEVAKKYPQLSPEGKKRLQDRMGEYARMTPEQRRTARQNFQRAYELPIEQREALMQQYQDLPDDRKRELSEKAEKAAQKKPPVVRKEQKGVDTK